MLIENLYPLTTPLSRIQEIPEVFFSNMEESDSFGDNLFPNWLFDESGKSIVFNNQTVLKAKFKAIYDKYKAIQNPDSRAKVIDAFINTNNIEDLCNNNTQVGYFELQNIDTNIQSTILETFLYLYQSALEHPPFIEFINDDLDKALKRFINANGIEICPFCGLEIIIQIPGQPRISIDHWLNKDRFPFSAVNFKNLVPIGSQCNSRGVKGTKNVLKDKTQQNRVKSFYPFSTHHGINVKFIFFKEPSIENTKDTDWKLEVSPNDESELDIFTSWDFIFNISERYTGYLKNYPLVKWEKEYYSYIEKDNDDIKHANTVDELKQNLKEWKKTFIIRKYHGSIIYRAFIDYLTDEASEEYLFGLCENFKSWHKNSYIPFSNDFSNNF